MLCSAVDPKPWDIALEAMLDAGEGDIARTSERVRQQVDEIGTSYRLPGEQLARQWPVSPLPLLIDAREWDGIAAGVMQRAELAEMLLADLYGLQQLVTSGMLPASVLTGCPHYLRPMVGIAPPGGHYLHVYAADLGRGPDGEWRVLADHSRSPAGAGYALENRLAVSNVLGGLAKQLNIARLAPFFAELRSGIAASCQRSDPRIALLTPGRLNQSYPEQAHLARYLGLPLVEGADLTVRDDRLYLRTVEGMKRVDALWQRMDARLLDPLTLDSRSTVGVPGLIDVLAAADLVVANFPGAAMLESHLFMAFMPALCQRLMGAALRLPNIATWWCGQEAEAGYVSSHINELQIASAFSAEPVETDPAELRAAMKRRPHDYIGQEVVQLSTMPVVQEGQLVPRPFTLRVFAARAADGHWTVMPGGFVRIGADSDSRASSIGVGAQSADVIVHGASPVEPVTLLSGADGVAIRRNPGTLPSRVADNLYWLGRYLERGEAVLALVRAGSGTSLLDGGGTNIPDITATRIRIRLESDHAAPANPNLDFGQILAASLSDPHAEASVAALLAAARQIGEGMRERLSPDFWQQLDAPFPVGLPFSETSMILKGRFAALAGLASEHMGRTAAWRFHDLGRRIERAIALSRLIAAFADDDARAEDLTILLDLCDVQISYRQRYATGLALYPVRDLVGLDPYNPRSISFQMTAIGDHLAALPRLQDDGMAEAQQSAATALVARIATLSADTLNGWTCVELEQKILALSDAIANRFFLQGSGTVRASGMTLA